MKEPMFHHNTTPYKKDLPLVNKTDYRKYYPDTTSPEMLFLWTEELKPDRLSEIIAIQRRWGYTLYSVHEGEDNGFTLTFARDNTSEYQETKRSQKAVMKTEGAAV